MILRRLIPNALELAAANGHDRRADFIMKTSDNDLGRGAKKIDALQQSVVDPLMEAMQSTACLTLLSPPWPLSVKAAAVADMLSCLLMTQAV
jgi:hypothetical protein